MTNKKFIFERLHDIHLLTDEDIKQLLRILVESVRALERQVEELKTELAESKKPKH